MDVVRGMTGALFAAFILTATHAQESTPDPKALVDEAIAKYQSLESLSVSGESFAEMEMEMGQFKMVNAFTIRLARPTRYLISWEPKGDLPMMPKGAVWNTGSEPLLFMGSGNAYTPMSDDMMALAAATGISSGAANTLPSLFFAGTPGFTPSIFATLHDHQYGGEEVLSEEPCHVITAASAVSNHHTLWISKDRHVLLKHQYTMGGEDGPTLFEGLSDVELEDAAGKLGDGEKGEHLIDQTKETAKMASEMMRQMKAVMGETYTAIDLNPALGDDAFAYALPEGATREESFFDALDGMQESAQNEYNQKMQVGDTAPEFDGELVDGSKLALEEYKGKVVLLDFWATWCGPCVADIPNVIATYDKFGEKGLTIIGISLDESRDDLLAFLKEHEGMKWPIVFDGKGWENAIAKAYGVDAIPFTLLLDREGVVQGRDLHGAKLDAAVESLLNAPAE